MRRLLRVAVLLALPWAPAMAHDARPLFIDVQQLNATDYQLRLRLPPALAPADAPRLDWAPGCAVLAGSPGRLRCEEATTAPAFTLAWPRGNPALATAVRLRPLQGEDRWQMLSADQRRWQAPPVPRWQTVLKQYLQLGLQHIVLGFDHLLFVTGLLLLAVTWRRVLVVVTGFTLSHSLTLGLAASGALTLPIAATEAVIALSILFLAFELGRPDSGSLTQRRPALVAVAFGLLHGLGFAAVLGELGLPPGQRLTALAAFNVGVELGQLLFIALLGAVVLALRRLPGLAGALTLPRLQRAGVYAIGIPAAWWLIDRLLAMF